MKPRAITTDEQITLVNAEAPDVCRYCGRQRERFTEVEQCIARDPTWAVLWPRHYWIPAPKVTTAT
jgi:hypothetical protein